MNILAIESADGSCSVALWQGGQCTLTRNLVVKDSLSWMAAEVARLRTGAGLAWNDLDGIACCVGPGGFTGVRVAVGYVQGLGMATGLPVLPISSLDAMAWRLGRNSDDAIREIQEQKPLDHCWVALDARMGELYAAEYRREPEGAWQRVADEQLISPATLQAHFDLVENDRFSLAGPGFEAYPEAFSSRTQLGVSLDAEAVAALAEAAPKEQWMKAEDLAPTYLRNNIAETLAERQAKKAKSQ